MDDERRGGLADVAGPMIAGQHPFPAPSEAVAVTPAAFVTELAQSAAVEGGLAAGAAQRELFLGGGDHEEGAGSARDNTFGSIIGH